MGVKLQVEAGPEPGREFVFAEADRFLIGRVPGAHCRLPEGDKAVSRNHCVIEICPPKIYLRDLNSTNGTFVNGRRTTETCLEDGDRIRVGRTTLCVSISDAAPEPDAVPDACASPTGPIELPADTPPAACSACGRGVAAKASPAERYLCRECADQTAVDTVRPQRIGDFRLLKVLGEGGMGIVYQAWEEPTGRLVALKRLRPGLAEDRKAVRLFEREMRMLEQLDHPGIVRLISHGISEAQRYFVFEYVAGGDLAQLVAQVRRSPLTLDETCRYIGQILAGLEYAHQRGIVHRDVKPPNVLLQRSPRGYDAKLADFGLAKSFVDAGASLMTQRGEAAGTLLYMAPEQIFNYRYVKPAADLYSVGVTMYYLLSGKYPFEFPSPLERVLGACQGKKYKDEVRIILEDEPVPLLQRCPSIPAAIAGVVDRAVRKKEAERFGSAAEMQEAIRQAV